MTTMTIVTTLAEALKSVEKGDKAILKNTEDLRFFLDFVFNYEPHLKLIINVENGNYTITKKLEL